MSRKANSTAHAASPTTDHFAALTVQARARRIRQALDAGRARERAQRTVGRGGIGGDYSIGYFRASVGGWLTETAANFDGSADVGLLIDGRKVSLARAKADGAAVAICVMCRGDKGAGSSTGAVDLGGTRLER